MTITTETLQGLTAPPPAAPASTEPATPAAPPAPETPTGEKAVQAKEHAKKATVRERMKEATKAALDMAHGATPPAPASTAEPPAAPPAPEATEEALDPNKIAWDAAAGRWRDPATGNFVPAPEGATPPAEGEQPAPAEAVTEESEETPEEAPVARITLPRPGGGEDVTIDVDDPEVAELVQHYKNNGMRREEFNKRIASVEQKESDFREFQARLEHTPESIVDTLSPENRQRFTTYILAQEFDRLLPMLQQWAENDLTRQQALLGAQQRAFLSQQNLNASLAAQRSERAVLKAIDTLIPDHASPADADDFRQVAIARLTAVAQSGGDVRPETVVQHLDRDIRRFGFLPPVDPDPTKTPSLLPTKTAPGAQAPTPANVAQRAAEQQQRLAEVAKQRAAAAPIVPRGTGAAAQSAFPRPASFKDASKLVNSIPKDQWQRSFNH